MLLAAAPQVLDHPIDIIVRSLPWWFFMLVHIALFVIGAYFAVRAFDASQSLFGWGFALFALGEISYMTYHVNITNFLFAHTISEVLDGVAFVVLFAAAVQKGLIAASGKQPAGTGR
jgi:hypothetical protein